MSDDDSFNIFANCTAGGFDSIQGVLQCIADSAQVVRQDNANSYRFIVPLLVSSSQIERSLLAFVVSRLTPSCLI
jgi:hypothetical protein